MTHPISHPVMKKITQAQTRILGHIGDGNLEMHDEPPLA